jgi:hypothetical protein
MRGREVAERGKERENTHFFEYVAKDAIGVWSQSRFLRRSTCRLTLRRTATGAAEHTGERSEKVSRCIWVVGSLR